jgi:quercetin dioxygenase-like cupin family protein
LSFFKFKYFFPKGKCVIFVFSQEGPVSEKILFPEMIEKLPDIDIPFPNVRGKLFQGQGMQAVFFTTEGPGEIPPHHHQAQWGVMLEGEAELTVDGKMEIIRQGDSYFIPADSIHSIRILSPMKALDFFNEPSRYKVKS